MRQFVTQGSETVSRLLFKHTILILTVIFSIGIAVALGNMSRLSTNLVQSQALHNAVLYARTMKEARTLYSDEVVHRIASDSGITVTHDYAKQEKGAIPLPATYLLDLSERIGENNPGIFIRLYSDYPFPWRVEGGPKDEFERNALQQLRQNPYQTFFRVESFEGRPSLRYAEADILKPSCIECHNTHPNTPKNDWKVGDVRGILEITQPLDSFTVETKTRMRETFVIFAILAATGLSCLTLMITRVRRTSKELERRVKERTVQLEETNEQLQVEQDKSERLLLNILPQTIADKLKNGHSNIADGFAEVTILFADIVGFTTISASIPPQHLVQLLNEIFSAFDALVEKHQLEKIKTIGDAYMVASGLPIPRCDHAEAIAAMALDMQQEVLKFNARNQVEFNLRIGINTGPVVAGVIGKKKFIYDLWGDAVNTASRMESHGITGAIQVSDSTYQLLKDQYEFDYRGRIEIKGKGQMETYFLKNRKTPVNSIASNAL